LVSDVETPWRRPHFPIELLTSIEMTEADRLAGATIPSHRLMENAGAATARAALRLLGSGGPRHAVVLCGPGNNGGDGFVVARLVADTGCRVTIGLLGRRDGLKGDAAEAATRWDGDVVSLGEAPIETADLVVDALFGAGLARAVEGEAAEAITRVNRWSKACGGPVLAIDVPSGIDGTTGDIRGVAIRATDTITFFRLKPGHVLLPGRLHCGNVSLADIGIETNLLEQIAPKTSLNAPGLWAGAYPVPRLDGHKYARGHAVVVSGPIAQTGAARLCARGALRAGAGLVTVATPAEALVVHATALTAIMTRVVDDAAALAHLLDDARHNAVVLGPGLGIGPGTRALVAAALRPQPEATPPRAVVLDADALTSFADTPDQLFAAIAAGGHAVVLTPHDGEFARLFGRRLDLSDAKPARTRAAAALSGAIVILKGPDTVVATPDGRAAIAASESAVARDRWCGRRSGRARRGPSGPENACIRCLRGGGPGSMPRRRGCMDQD
jgi:yjeF N-terminal region